MDKLSITGDTDVPGAVSGLEKLRSSKHNKVSQLGWVENFQDNAVERRVVIMWINKSMNSASPHDRDQFNRSRE